MLSEGESKLPERYRDDRLQVLATGPSGCYVSWDEGEAVIRLASRYLPQGWQTAPRQLRVRGAQGDVQRIACPADYGSTHIIGLRMGGRYRVEYGVLVAGNFLPLLEQQVVLPGNGIEREIVRERVESISSYSLYRQV